MPEIIRENILENYSIFNGRCCQLIWTVCDFILMDLEIFSKIVNDNQVLSIEIFLNKFLNFADLTSAGFLSSLIRCASRLKYFINNNQVYSYYYFFKLEI